jgi:hypothetical protein
VEDERLREASLRGGRAAAAAEGREDKIKFDADAAGDAAVSDSAMGAGLGEADGDRPIGEAEGEGDAVEERLRVTKLER